jgi:acetyl esterase/lipase
VDLLRFLTSLIQLFGRGRSPAMLLNLLAPRHGYRVYRDIPYAEGARHGMDIYVPDGRLGPVPVILFFYGGGFMAGRKSEYRLVGGTLAREGFVVAVADYRILPEARFPDFLEDGARAFAAVRRIAGQYGGDPNRIFIAGHSAGAYITAMLASDPRWLQQEGVGLDAVRGAIPIAGSYGAGRVTHPAFAGRAPEEVRPVYFVNGKRPPMMFASGGKDTVIANDGRAGLLETLRAHGGEVLDAIYPEAGHMGIILSLSPRFRHLASLREDIVRFVTAH